MHTLKMQFLHFQILIPQLKWICTLHSSKLSSGVSKHQYLLPNLAHIIKDGEPKSYFYYARNTPISAISLKDTNGMGIEVTHFYIWQPKQLNRNII